MQTTGNKRFIQILKLRNTIGVSVSGHVAPARAGLGEPREEHLVLVAGPRLLQQSTVMSRGHVTMSCHDVMSRVMSSVLSRHLHPE